MSSKNTIPSKSWESVGLYGVDHSPWVQGVWLALRQHGIPTRLSSYPISLSWFFTRGLVFPAIRLGDGSILLDSFRIYECMEDSGFQLGLETMSETDRLAAQVELERLFTAYALCRIWPGKKWRFISAWARMRESPGSILGIVWRALISMYFWMLIVMGIRLKRKAGRPLYDSDRFERLLSNWDHRLNSQQWLSGASPGFLDFALLGHFQCMASGLTDELFSSIRGQKHLMRWLRDMSNQVSDHSPLYVLRILDHRYRPLQATAWERLVFWISWIGWILLWPLSLALLGLSLWNRFSNPAHTGAVTKRRRAQTSSNEE